ncbi:MAG TPA: LTA synthase family protein [Nocardioidaceae bacterium]|nr:LTA synthase family protein [Nocardioidaceae bacterium]
MSTSRPGTDAPRPDGLRARLRLAGAPRVLRSTGIYAVFAVLVSLMSVVTLEIAWWGWDGARQQELLSDRPGVVVLAGVIVLLVVLLLLAVTGRMWVTSTIVLGTVTLLGVASNVKFDARREPVYPRDLPFLREPGFLLQMVEPQLLWLTALGAGGLVAFTWGLNWLFSLWLRRGGEAPRNRRGRAALYVLRGAVAGVALLLLFPLMDFNRPANPWRLAFEEAGAHWRKASQPFNYQVNGFVGGFLYNLDTPAMSKPPGYSRAELERITAKYTAAAERVNELRRPRALDDVNVVMVLAESFSDPTLLEGFELAEDPIPRTRALMEQLPHGLTLSSKVGGGTSSMEFEALTGMSLSQFHPTMDTPYQMLVPSYHTFPSVLGLFEEAGHTTLAIHPNTGRFYERDRTYPILGFSDFIEKQEMEYRGKIKKYRSTPYISDTAAFRETLAAIDTHDEPLFVNLVTMQNHGPYTDKYPDPIGVTGLDEDDAAMVGQYSRGLSHTDEALEKFVRRIERSGEKTLLVYYGDHLPGYPGTLFEQNSHRTMHEPPFFIYSNFKDLRAEELPTTSPIHFLPRALDMIGAPLPPYFVLLRELEEHIPAMTHGTIIDPDDREISPEELSPEAREVLRDYRLVQYDLSIGERYAEKLMHPTPIGTVAASDAAE